MTRYRGARYPDGGWSPAGSIPAAEVTKDEAGEFV